MSKKRKLTYMQQTRCITQTRYVHMENVAKTCVHLTDTKSS